MPAGQDAAHEARGIFVVDKKGVVRYIEVVKEMMNEPNYDEVLDFVKNLEAVRTA